MLQKLQKLQNFAKFQKIQLDNLVDFEKCFKTRIYLQRSVPIQPKTSDILPKNWQLAVTRSYVQLRAATRSGSRCGTDFPSGFDATVMDVRRRKVQFTDEFDSFALLQPF